MYFPPFSILCPRRCCLECSQATLYVRFDFDHPNGLNALTKNKFIDLDQVNTNEYTRDIGINIIRISVGVGDDLGSASAAHRKFLGARCVPKAPIAGADINGCYLEADIKIQTSNAYLVPVADSQGHQFND